MAYFLSGSKERLSNIVLPSTCSMLDNLSLDPDKKYAIVMGNEVKGVQQEVVNACDGCIEIPQYGTKHSLNVSVTTGIVLWEFAKRMMAF